MNSKTIIAIAVVAVVVVAAAAAIVLTRQSNEKSSDSNVGAIVGTQLQEADYPNTASRLWVYGNANEDDKFTSEDIDYIQAIVDGKKDATVLADANGDGKVTSADVEYAKTILNADDTTKTTVFYVDNYYQVAQVHWPVTSIAIGFNSGAYCADLCGLLDKVKMVDDTIAKTDWKKINSLYSTLPSFGWEETPDREAVLQAGIDVFCPGYCDPVDEESKTFFKGTSTDLMFMNTCDCDIKPKDDIDRSVVMFGFLCQGDMDSTYEYLDWHDGIMTKVKNAVSGLSEDEKVNFLMFRSSPSYTTDGLHRLIGKGNTCTIHADIAGVNVPGQDDELTQTYNAYDADAVFAMIDKYAVNNKMFIVDNENDGIRHQRDLGVTTKAIYDTFKSSDVELVYFGQARETCNSPLYVAETVFYLQYMYPDLNTENLDCMTVLQEYFQKFVSEYDTVWPLVEEEHFFIQYDFSDS